MIIGEFAITQEGTRYIFGTQNIFAWSDFRFMAVIKAQKNRKAEPFLTLYF
jgi:hypothetical protein